MESREHERAKIQRNLAMCCVVSLAILTSYLASNYLYQMMNPQLDRAPANFDQFVVHSCTSMPVGASPTYTYVNMSIQNTGSSSWTLQSTAWVGANTNVTVAYTAGAKSFTCLSGKTIYVTLTPTDGFRSGSLYSITLLLKDGTEIIYTFTPS